MIHFAVAPHRAAGVNAVEARLRRDLLAVQGYIAEEAKHAAARRDAAWRKPRLPKALERRVQETVLTLLRLGVRDARQEMQEASRRPFAAFAEEPVLEADIAAYRRLASVLAEQMAAEQYEALKSVIVDGLRAGLTDREIGAELRDAGLFQSAAHAKTWARTETTRYYTIGRAVEIEGAGDAVWGYEYVVIEDTRTTTICRELVGKRVPKAEMTSYPPFHYNCRTTIMAVMAEWVTDEDPTPEGTLLTNPIKPAEGFGAALPIAA